MTLESLNNSKFTGDIGVRITKYELSSQELLQNNRRKNDRIYVPLLKSYFKIPLKNQDGT